MTLTNVVGVLLRAINYNRLTSVFFLMAMGVMIGYFIGMHQNPIVHETFHDLRHAMGFPCH